MFAYKRLYNLISKKGYYTESLLVAIALKNHFDGGIIEIMYITNGIFAKRHYVFYLGGVPYDPLFTIYYSKDFELTCYLTNEKRLDKETKQNIEAVKFNRSVYHRYMVLGLGGVLSYLEEFNILHYKELTNYIKVLNGSSCCIM